MTRAPALLAIASLVACLHAAVARADVVRLVGGGEVRGDVVETEGGVLVRLPNGTVVTVPRADILEVLPDAVERELAERRAVLRPYDADGHCALGLWCLERGLTRTGEELLRRALEIQPDHEGAHRGLGHVQEPSGAWLTLEESYARRGFTRLHGRWVSPEEARSIREAERIEELARLIHRLARKLRTELPEEVAAARETLVAIDDPLAVDLIEELVEDRDPEVREGATAALARFETDEVTDLLMGRAVRDSSPLVRRTAREALRARRSEDVARRAVRAYLEESRPLARRAGVELLVELHVRDAVDALIDTVYLHLVESYGNRYLIAGSRPGQHTALPFRDSDIADLPAAGCRLVDDVVYNLAAHDALVDLTGEDFGYQQAEWRDWWDEHRPEYGPFLEPVPDPGASSPGR